MNDILWPLPNNSRGLMPFTNEPVATYVMDENTIGAPNIRSRTTKLRHFHTFYMIFTDAEFETVKNWVHTQLHDGILEFKFPRADNWTADTTQWVTYRFAIEQTNTLNWFDSLQHEYDWNKVRFILELME